MHYLLHFLHSVLLTMTLRNSISSFFFNSSFLSYILYLIYTTLILSVLYSIYFIILGSIARFYGVKETFSSLLQRICLHPNDIALIVYLLTYHYWTHIHQLWCDQYLTWYHLQTNMSNYQYQNLPV